MKKYYYIPVITLVSLLVVIAIYFLTMFESSIPNGFNRIYSSHRLLLLKSFDLKSNSYYISGLSNKRIFLGNYYAPMVSMSLNYSLNDTNLRRLPFKYSKNIEWSQIKQQVEYPNYYLSEFASPALLFSKYPFNKDEGTVRVLNGFLADEIKVLSTSSIVLRDFDTTLKQKILKKIVIRGKQNVAQVYRLPIQKEGVFSIDGFFTLNKKLGRIFYTFYYRNQFLCLDTNLNYIYTGKTIDTNKLAKIAITQLRTESSVTTTHSKIPKFVTKRGYSNEDKLYLNGSLIADNDKKYEFRSSSAIDVYDLSNGKYRHSFLIPNFQGNNILDFAIYEDKIIAIQDHYLVVYQYENIDAPIAYLNRKVNGKSEN